MQTFSAAQGENLDDFGALTHFSDNMYVTASEKFFYETVTPHRKIILKGFESDYIPYGNIGVELTSIIIFAIIAVITFVTLIVIKHYRECIICGWIPVAIIIIF